MSARRRPGECPSLNVRDAALGGEVVLWRNPAGKPFKSGQEAWPADVWRISAAWSRTGEIASAYEQAEAQEAQLARQHDFAWDPDFGYLSPDPCHCGTALTLEGEFHLEGLHLIGDLPPVLAALRAVRYVDMSIHKDGIAQSAHIFRISNAATLGLAERELLKRGQRIFDDLAVQELNARKALVEDTPRILEDSVSRALAVLRNARLLSPGELLDLLSPIRLATTLGILSGITRAETARLMRQQIDTADLPPPRTSEDDRRRDDRDAGIADWANRRFAEVSFNNRADELFD